MKPDDLENVLRARLRAAVDPLVPGRAAEERVMRTLADHADGTAGRGLFGLHLGSGMRAALVATAALLVIGGALGGSMVALHDRATGGGGQANGPAPVPPSALPSASPSPSPTPASIATPTAVAGLPTCDGSELTGRLADSVGAAGTDGADIVLHNRGSVACTMEGYTNIEGLAGNQVTQLGVTHSVGGTILNNNNGTLPTVSLVTLQPGADAYVAFEYSSVNSGPTACPAYTGLLVTPPQGHAAVRVTSSTALSTITLCGGYGASIWIDEAPVSTSAYFKR